MKIIRNIFLAFVCLLAVGCVQTLTDSFNVSDGLSGEEYKNLVNDHLKPGDSKEKIVNFLESQKWNFSYDDFRKAFQISDPQDNGQVFRYAIYIYVDDSKSFPHVEIDKFYNGL
ncbi:MAG: hypothetical protein GY820_27825 [Gammaproteobacteria bacterium]|nr:hypothetical protein [Gammaproteobacteria bacterium]